MSFNGRVITHPLIADIKSQSAASVYSGYEVDDDWCVSVLQSYQADRDVPFPWSVGRSSALFSVRCTQHMYMRV